MRVTLFLCLAGLLACGNTRKSNLEARPAPSGLPPSSTTGPAAASAPAPMPGGGAAPSAQGAAAPESGGVTVSGKVAERIDAPPYSYLRITTADGEQWAAVSQTQANPGDAVTVSGMVMEGFESKTLKRRFDRIVFGNLVGPGGSHPDPTAQAPVPAQPASANQPGAEHTTTPAAADVKVPIAEGPDATNIAGVYANKAALAGKPVAVRGKVVKLNSGIMGKNWLHIQDGSGSAAAGDHDLAVTTTDDVKLGDVITARGPLHLDRDFGAGYRYVVIIEDAKLQR